VVHLQGDIERHRLSPAAGGSDQEHVQAWPRPANRDILNPASMAGASKRPVRTSRRHRR
jgi:hypothetical protein